jgi:hypothetical protein
MPNRLLLLTLLLCVSFLFADQLKPGVDRWKVKTSVIPAEFHKTPKKMNLGDLLTLAPPDPTSYTYKTFDQQTDDKRMRGKNNVRPQEGDVVYTEGYVQLVMLSKDKNDRDGDYHVQVTTDVHDRKDCFIVEVPDDAFVSDANLANEGALRTTLKTKLKPTSGEFSTGGSCMTHPPRMGITGQLFYDVHHVSGTRGRHGCKSPTDWELHPVFKMKFLDPAGTSPNVGKCPKS